MENMAGLWCARIAPQTFGSKIALANQTHRRLEAFAGFLQTQRQTIFFPWSFGPEVRGGQGGEWQLALQLLMTCRGRGLGDACQNETEGGSNSHVLSS